MYVQVALQGASLLLHYDRQLIRGWTSWAAATMQQFEQQNVAHRSFTFLIDRTLLRALLRWRNYARCYMWIQSSVKNLIHRQLARSFRALREELEVAAALRALLQHSLLHWLRTKLFRGWTSWTSFMMRRNQSLDVLRQGLARARNVVLCKGWESWLTTTTYRKIELSAVERS
eukprot:2761371-Prymnesium_polylepis.1